jgi:hypothetical protein
MILLSIASCTGMKTVYLNITHSTRLEWIA